MTRVGHGQSPPLLINFTRGDKDRGWARVFPFPFLFLFFVFSSRKSQIPDLYLKATTAITHSPLLLLPSRLRLRGTVVACIHSSSLTTRMMQRHLTFYSPHSILVSQMVPRSRTRLTPCPLMSSNSTPLVAAAVAAVVVALPSRAGDPLRSPITHSNGLSKLTPVSIVSRPHRRNSINLTR